MKTEIERLEKEMDAELESIRAKKKMEVTTKMKDTAGNAPITLDDAHFNDTVHAHPLMLIDCWAAWCGPCRMIAPVVDELARDYAGQVTVGKLNVDENPKTATAFCIVSIPTLLIMKDGKEADRIIGVVPKKAIQEKLRKYL